MSEEKDKYQLPYLVLLIVAERILLSLLGHDPLLTPGALDDKTAHLSEMAGNYSATRRFLIITDNSYKYKSSNLTQKTANFPSGNPDQFIQTKLSVRHRRSVYPNGIKETKFCLLLYIV